MGGSLRFTWGTWGSVSEGELRAFCLFGFSLVWWGDNQECHQREVHLLGVGNAMGGFNRMMVIKGGTLCSLLRSVWRRFTCRRSWAACTLLLLWRFALSGGTVLLVVVQRQPHSPPPSWLNGFGQLKLRCPYWCYFKIFYYRILQHT